MPVIWIGSLLPHLILFVIYRVNFLFRKGYTRVFNNSFGLECIEVFVYVCVPKSVSDSSLPNVYT